MSIEDFPEIGVCKNKIKHRFFLSKPDDCEMKDGNLEDMMKDLMNIAEYNELKDGEGILNTETVKKKEKKHIKIPSKCTKCKCSFKENKYKSLILLGSTSYFLCDFCTILYEKTPPCLFMEFMKPDSAEDEGLTKHFTFVETNMLRARERRVRGEKIW
jgi:hypothetical protein